MCTRVSQPPVEPSAKLPAASPEAPRVQEQPTIERRITAGRATSEENPTERREKRIRALRAELLREPIRTDVLCELFLRPIKDGTIWFDAVGWLAQVEAEAPKEEFLADFVLALIYPDSWPPERPTDDHADRASD